MKRVLYSVFYLLLLHPAYAQVNKLIQPASLSLPQNLLPQPVKQTLPAFNLALAQSLDNADAINNKVPAFSRSVYTNITLDNSGNWSELPNGDGIWRALVSSEGAQALIPYFNKFYLPNGSTLHVYSPDKKEILGAFTSANNPSDGLYSTGLIHGESFILEYYEPKAVRGQGILNLNQVGHAYRSVGDYFQKKSLPTDSLLGFQQSGYCEVNVNCSEGNNWRDQQRAIACIIIQGRDAQYLCSGSIVNNTRQDCTPYFLSAQHCSENSDPDQYSQWVFYFNYEAPGCDNPSSIGSSVYDFIVGCSKIATSDDNGGETGSDFLLLKLSHQPTAYNAYYAGWSTHDIAPQSGVGIHHPKGDIKKISTFTIPATSGSYAGNVQNTHWAMHWSQTTNGYGVTEGGSSGSPLFNEAGLIVGQLTSGSSDCTDLLGHDFYGKIAYDWASNGNHDTLQLKPWLDPDNTNDTVLQGKSGCPTSTGLQSLATESQFRVNPNPSNGLVNLYFNSGDEKNMQVFDVEGRLVAAQKISGLYSTLDLRQLNKGVYVINAETQYGRTAQKLVIE